MTVRALLRRAAPPLPAAGVSFRLGAHTLTMIGEALPERWPNEALVAGDQEAFMMVRSGLAFTAAAALRGVAGVIGTRVKGE